MPLKTFVIWINDDCLIQVQFETFNGRVVSFVVRLSLAEGTTRSIARYDTAHGCPHLDLVDRMGQLREKRWLLGMSLEEALEYAITDFKLNYERYIKDFQKNA